MLRRLLLMMMTAMAGVTLVSGCADSHPPIDSSLTEATAKGFVKLKGKPAKGGGTIVFNPSNVERKVAASTATINDDGSYFLKTYSGGNEVKFSGPFMKDERGLAMTTRYCELSAGENVIDFDLLGENDHPRGAIYPSNPKQKVLRRK
jgi:hypothetical protein